MTLAIRDVPVSGTSISQRIERHEKWRWVPQAVKQVVNVALAQRARAILVHEFASSPGLYKNGHDVYTINSGLYKEVCKRSFGCEL